MGAKSKISPQKIAQAVKRDANGEPVRALAKDWVTVAQYADVPSTQIASRLLSGLGIRNRIYSPGPILNVPLAGESCVWVPPELVDAAKKALAQSGVSDKELTEQALKYPPPDDL